MIILRKNSIPILFILFLAGCSAAIFSQSSYDNAQSLKTESLALMSKATENYSMHQGEADSLNAQLTKQISLEKKRSDNEETVQLYQTLVNPNGSLLGGFLRQWKNSGTLSSTFITQFKTQVSEAYNKIIALEVSKK